MPVSPSASLAAVVLGLSFLLWVYGRMRRHERRLAQRVAAHTHSLQEANRRLAATAADLQRAQADLVESAHRAGMAEVASDVLHNIGNALTSLQVSASLVESKINAQPLDFLKNLGDLLAQQEARLPAFFSERRGQLVPQAVNRLALKMELTRAEMLEEMKILHEQIFQINEIVISQRDYTFAGKLLEAVDIRHLLDDVLCFQEAKIEEFQIKVSREYAGAASIHGAKAVLLHIINHLVRNAVEALCQAEPANRRLSLRVRDGARDNLVLEVADNGVGIAADNLTAIFAQNRHHERKNGQRRGNLHYCANAISGMGGALSAHSEGRGKGAVFTLEVPRNPRDREARAVDQRVGYDA